MSNSAPESIQRLRSACWKTSPTIGSALRAPWPQDPIVSLSLKPTRAPATSCGCIMMNQLSVFSCVVPVLPATSAVTPWRCRMATPVPSSTTPRIAFTSSGGAIETEVTDDFEEMFATNAGGYLDPSLVHQASEPCEQWPALLKSLGFADPEVVSALADAAGPTVQWLKTFGIRLDFLPTQFLTRSQSRLLPIGGERALIEALARNRTGRMPSASRRFTPTRSSLPTCSRSAGSRSIAYP